MRFATTLVLLTSLAGCAQYDEMKSANLAEAARARTAADDAACRPSGEPGSAAYDDCRKRYANQHASETKGHQRMMEQMLNAGAPIPSRGE
jgi:hypothetical protein